MSRCPRAAIRRAVVLLTAVVYGTLLVSTAPTMAAAGLSPQLLESPAFDVDAPIAPTTTLAGLRVGVARVEPRSVVSWQISTPRISLRNAAEGASNAANAGRLAAQLTRAEAEAIFTKSGGLKASVIRDSARIPSASGNRIGNPDVVADLKALGGSIEDWGKYTTPTFKSPAGRFQVHFYYNPTTGQAYYGRDYKAVFAGRPR